MIRFDCPSCGVRLRARDDWAGRNAHCKSCGQSISVPHNNQVSEDDILEWVGANPSGESDDSVQRIMCQQGLNASQLSSDTDVTHSRATQLRYLSAIPDGYRVYVPKTLVSGSHYRHHQVEELFGFEQPHIQLVAEPTNEHDPNAIKVLASNRRSGSQIHVGYVPAKLAKKITRSGMIRELHPRLRMVEAGGFVNVEFDICGPKSGMAAFDDAG